MRRFFCEIWETLKEEGLIFIIFLVACFTHNMDRGSIVYVALMAVILIKMLISPSRRLLDRTVFLLLLFGFFYVIFSPRFDFENAVRVLLGPSLFYVYGRYTVARASYNQEHIQKMILLMIVCMSFPVWWAVISNMLAGNILSATSAEGARWLTTWGQSKMVAATTYGLIASFGLCGIGYFIVSKDKFSRIEPWLFLICAICSFLTSTYLINRSGIVILAIATIVALLYGLRRNTNRTIISLIIVVVVLLLFLPQWGGVSIIEDAYSERESITTSGGDRTWRWVDALGRLFTMPFGWSTEQSSYIYVHNMWLDVARVAGILPFITFVVVTIRSIKTNLSLYRNKGIDLVLLLITLYSAVFSAYMIEPVLDANIFYLMIFTWIWGVEKEELLGTNKVGPIEKMHRTNLKNGIS